MRLRLGSSPESSHGPMRSKVAPSSPRTKTFFTVERISPRLAEDRHDLVGLLRFDHAVPDLLVLEDRGEAREDPEVLLALTLRPGDHHDDVSRLVVEAVEV